ncbi:GAF domain-containing SpoIIE family protein phosphatase [Poriferisphaera sp. WC338]|uniref:GAF domain-containing SpoIIE family protein phosphatase n=1 Tax=Poriferisphaera sp. WC338 TaxID=3425129 RepID=UPI003D816395
MIAPLIPNNEAERLADLQALRILDTPEEERYQRVIRMASSTAEVPIAYIAMIDSDRQWLKAKCGLTFTETGRDVSFCGHTILQDEPLIIPNTTLDPRFQNNPLVKSEPHLRFYAGFPLKGPEGYNVGTLCIADIKPRNLSPKQLAMMMELASLTEQELHLVDLVESQHELLSTKSRLLEAQGKLNSELQDASEYVKSLIPDPIRHGLPLEGQHSDTEVSPITTDWVYLASSVLGGDLFGYHEVEPGKIAIYLLDVCGHGVSASLLAATAFHAIRNQTLPKTLFDDPTQVLESLNRAFPMQRHQHKFFTLWYGVYNEANRSLHYAAAGHHPATLFLPGSEEPMLLGSPNFMIGAMDPEAFEVEAEQMTIPAGSILYVFSDGLFEIKEKQAGPLLGLEAFNRVLAADHHCPLDAIIRELQVYLANDTFPDDLSLLKVTFN